MREVRGASEVEKRERGILNGQARTIKCGVGVDISFSHCPKSSGINGM